MAKALRFAIVRGSGKVKNANRQAREKFLRARLAGVEQKQDQGESAAIWAAVFERSGRFLADLLA